MPQLKDGHSVTLLQGGAEFFPALVRAIDESQHEVRLETYIFNFDVSGIRVAEALIKAARRGVAVRVVIDGAGTPDLSLEWTGRFDEAGVEWRLFSRLSGLGWFVPSRWRRLHRKLCVVDGRIAFCGGINVLDDFYDPNHGALDAPRFDFAVAVTGPLVRDVTETMAHFWWRLKAVREARHFDFSGAWTALQAAIRPSQIPAPALLAPLSQVMGPGSHRGARAGLVLRDNLRRRTRIERAYRQAIAEANSEIIIANAYFVPGAKLRRALINAARRGVKVRLLLQGRYEYFMQYHAARPVLGQLLAAGVEIHEYARSFLHAKVAVVDGHWATVGSSNLDPLSLLLAREANVVVLNEPFARDLRHRLNAAMQHHGQLLDPAAYANRPWRQRLLDRCAFGLMRLLLFLNGSRY
jgi:cardiolipin synthase